MLGMTKVSDWLVPRYLTPDPKRTSRENLTFFEADASAFLESFLNQDECHFHYVESDKIHAVKSVYPYLL